MKVEDIEKHQREVIQSRYLISGFPEEYYDAVNSEDFRKGKQAGMRFVVEWIQSHQLIEPTPDSITRFEPFYQISKAKLKVKNESPL